MVKKKKKNNKLLVWLSRLTTLSSISLFIAIVIFLIGVFTNIQITDFWFKTMGYLFYGGILSGLYIFWSLILVLFAPALNN